MASNFDSNTLALRALNYWRHRSHLSYFALRSLLLRSNEFDLSIVLKNAESLLPRVGTLTFPELIYKGTSNGEHSYREITALSPHFAILESFILGNLSTLPSTFHDSNVYSYHWSKSKNPSRFFEFYRQRYVERNELIQATLNNHQDSVAVSMDVKSFYPSCSHSQCLRVLDEAVQGYNFGGLTMRYVEAILSTVQKGLPIGPAISHVIGNLIMREIDSKLRQIPSLLYTRYVDDIVFVVLAKDAESTKEAVENVFADTELDCQEDKTDITTLAEWQKFSPKYSSAFDSDSFEAIESRVQMYLLFKPHKADSLMDALRSEAISINVDWLRSSFSTSRWQKFIKSRSKVKWFQDYWKATFLDDEISIMKKCLEVRGNALATYNSVVQEPRPISKTAIKWQSKRVGYLALRLAELFPVDSLSHVEASANDFDLPAVSAILKDLQSKTIENSLVFPGSAISFLCSQWNAAGWEVPAIDISENKAVLYSVLSIVTQMETGSLAPQLDSREGNVAALIRWIVRQPGYPQAPLETFERELQCILNKQNFDGLRKTIHKTRFSDGESVDGASFALEVISSLQSG